MKNFHQNTIGILWFVLHCFLFAVISAITKKLLINLNVFQVLFSQAVICALILLPIIYMRHGLELKTTNYRIHIIRAFFWAVASSMFFYSIIYIPMPKAIAISFAVPLFTSIMAIIFLKEDMHWHRMVSLAVGIMGMLVIIQPGMSSFEMISIIVVGAAFCWSITDIIIKLQSLRNHAYVNTFLFSIFAALWISPLAIYFFKMPSLEDTLLLLLLGFVFAINIVSVSKSYSNAALTVIMPFTFSQLIFVAILSYLFYDEIIDLGTAIGSVIIICSTSYIAYREKKLHGHLLVRDLGKELRKEEIL